VLEEGKKLGELPPTQCESAMECGKKWGKNEKYLPEGWTTRPLALRGRYCQGRGWFFSLGVMAINVTERLMERGSHFHRKSPGENRHTSKRGKAKKYLTKSSSYKCSWPEIKKLRGDFHETLGSRGCEWEPVTKGCRKFLEKRPDGVKFGKEQGGVEQLSYYGNV